MSRPAALIRSAISAAERAPSCPRTSAIAAPMVWLVALFLFAALTGLTANVGVTLAGVYFLGLPPLFAKLVGIGTAFLVNFGLNVRIVFPPKA